MRKQLILLAFAAGLGAQTFPSHVAMDALLKMRYYPDRGSFLMDTPIPVLFPPAGGPKGRLLIKKAGGGIAVAKDVFVDHFNPFNAFGNLKPAGNDPFVGPIGAGDYVMSVEINGKEITAYPFSLKSTGTGDPFNPQTELVRTGPWSKTMFLIGPVEDTGLPVTVGLFVSTRELPGYAPGKPAKVSLHLLRGSAEIGAIETTIHQNDWNFSRNDLRFGREHRLVAWKTLVSNPGAYTLEYRSGGKVIRSHKFTVAGGTVTRIPQNEPGYTGTDALPPQTILQSKRMQEFWLAPIL